MGVGPVFDVDFINDDGRWDEFRKVILVSEPPAKATDDGVVPDNHHLLGAARQAVHEIG